MTSGPRRDAEPSASGALSDSAAQAPPERDLDPPEAGSSADSVPLGEHHELRSKIGKGLAWSVLNTIVGRLGSFISGIILARILAPADYGLFTTAMVVLAALLSMNELGVSLAIVRWPSNPRIIAPTVATLSLLSSGLLYLGVFLAAPVIAASFNAPEAVTLIRVLGVCVLMDAITAVPAAVINREMQQARRLVMDLIGFAVGTAVTLTLAVLGFGAWSMVIGTVTTSFVTMISCLVLAPWSGYGFRRDQLGPLLSFGLPLAGASVLTFLLLNVDFVIVAQHLDPTALGLYTIAFNLCNWPILIVSTTVRRVALAGFARFVGDPPAAGRAFATATRIVMTAGLAACIPLAVFSTPLIELIYGEKWGPAGPALSFLAVLALGRILLELGYDYLVAFGRTRSNLVLQAIWLITFAGLATLGVVLDGIRGVAVAHAVVSVAIMIPLYLVVLRRHGVRAHRVVGSVGRPFAAGVAMLLVCLASHGLVDRPILQILGGGTAGVAVFALVAWPLVRQLLAAVRTRSFASD